MYKFNSVIYFKSIRGHSSAVARDYTGIFIELFISGLAIHDSSLAIWEIISNHLNEKRERKQIVRIIDLGTVGNICQFDFIVNKKYYTNKEIINHPTPKFLNHINQIIPHKPLSL